MVLGAMAIAVGGCEANNIVLVPDPGSLVLTVETVGFMKDDSYEVLVNGESRGTVADGGQITVDELDEGTHAVTLGDLASNCAYEALDVDVESQQSTAATMAVTCTFETPVSYSLRFSRERPDLETGDITECPFSICPSGAEWDMYVHYNSSSDPHSVIRQNESDGVEIAHLAGVTLATLTEAHLMAATFTVALVGDAFDPGRVVLLRTTTGRVYALGNPSEDDTAQEATFDVALIVMP
jgi:hypothetical protein